MDVLAAHPRGFPDPEAVNAQDSFMEDLTLSNWSLLLDSNSTWPCSGAVRDHPPRAKLVHHNHIQTQISLTSLFLSRFEKPTENQTYFPKCKCMTVVIQAIIYLLLHKELSGHMFKNISSSKFYFRECLQLFSSIFSLTSWTLHFREHWQNTKWKKACKFNHFNELPVTITHNQKLLKASTYFESLWCARTWAKCSSCRESESKCIYFSHFIYQ